MTIHIIPFLGERGNTTFLPLFLVLPPFKKLRIEVVQTKTDVNFCAQYLKYLMLQERMMQETKNKLKNPTTLVFVI